MNKVVYSLLVAVIALLLGPVAPAAAADTTPPTLTVTSPARFVVGSQIDAAVDPVVATEPMQSYTWDVVARLQWRGSDASGICGYDVESFAAGGWTTTLASGLTTRSYDTIEDDYDGTFGGGMAEVEGWFVTAHDCAGNSTRKFIDAGVVVLQQDGRTIWGGPFPAAYPTYSGTWGTSRCECWSFGSVTRTTQAGATMTYVNDGSVLEDFALVMEKAPNRGVARIYVNGVFRTAVDTYAPSPVHRVVVWERMLNPGDVVTVVNAATPGRPRIDIDALLLRPLQEPT